MAIRVGSTVVIDDSRNVCNINVLNSTLISPTNIFVIPAGDTASRPSAPSVGNIRFNTTTSRLEIFRDSTWNSL